MKEIDYRSQGKKEIDAVIAWREPPDSDKVVRWGRATQYFSPGEKGQGDNQSGGISLGFNTAENCRQLYAELTENGRKRKHPFHINYSGFGVVRRGDMQAHEALRIGDDPTILHIESIGRGTLRKLNGAISALFGEELPKAIIERIRERLPEEELSV
jgi:hypothetical protein